MSPQDALTVLNFMDQAPVHQPVVLRQQETLIRYAQPGSPAADLIKRDAEMLLALAPHGLPGPELLELDLSGRRSRHAFSLQRLPHPQAVPSGEGEAEAVWRQVGDYLRQLHSLPVLASGVVVPSPDPLRLLEQLNQDRAVTDQDANWLEDWIRSVQQAAGPAPVATLHGAVRPANILLSPDRQTFLGLLDWSRASGGEAARDYVHLPFQVSADMTAGDEPLTAQVLLAFITQLLLDLREAAQGRLALAAATSRLLALFRYSLR